MSNYDAYKNRYSSYNTISVAKWRDPSASVLPFRGGPKSPTISSEAAARPYMPTYKVKYKPRPPPEPTDDEEEEDEEEQESGRFEGEEGECEGIG